MIVGSDRYGCVCVLSFRQLLQALSLLVSRLNGKSIHPTVADLRTYIQGQQDTQCTTACRLTN